MPRSRPAQSPLFSREKHSVLIQEALQRLVNDARNDPRKLKQLQKILRAPKRFSRTLGQGVVSAASSVAPAIFRTLRVRGPGMLRERRAYFAAFERRLYKTWKQPLDLLEIFVVVCAEMGPGLSAQWPWKEESADRNLVFDVLRRLQARACQVASEILTLLRAGYAPAAHARWRTLHETAVTMFFISKHGPDVAKRFLAHEHVEAWKAAKDYQSYCRKLGYSPFSRKEMAGLRRNYNLVLRRYGNDFGKDYGWASTALPAKVRPTIKEIEKAVRLPHLRPYYRMASYPVHATVKSIRFSLALKPGTDLLLTGPSNLGLADPGHSTAISLGQATSALLALSPSVDSISAMRVLLLFVDEIGEAFLQAHHRLEARGKRRV